jgi:hypothetical protein
VRRYKVAQERSCLARRDLEGGGGGARRGGARVGTGRRGPEASTGATVRGSEAVTTGDGSVRGAELKAGRERGTARDGVRRSLSCAADKVRGHSLSPLEGVAIQSVSLASPTNSSPFLLAGGGELRVRVV